MINIIKSNNFYNNKVSAITPFTGGSFRKKGVNMRAKTNVRLKIWTRFAVAIVVVGLWFAGESRAEVREQEFQIGSGAAVLVCGNGKWVITKTKSEPAKYELQARKNGKVVYSENVNRAYDEDYGTHVFEGKRSSISDTDFGDWYLETVKPVKNQVTGILEYRKVSQIVNCFWN